MIQSSRFHRGKVVGQIESAKPAAHENVDAQISMGVGFSVPLLKPSLRSTQPTGFIASRNLHREARQHHGSGQQADDDSDGGGGGGHGVLAMRGGQIAQITQYDISSFFLNLTIQPFLEGSNCYLMFQVRE